MTPMILATCGRRWERHGIKEGNAMIERAGSCGNERPGATKEKLRIRGTASKGGWATWPGRAERADDADDLGHLRAPLGEAWH